MDWVTEMFRNNHNSFFNALLIILLLILSALIIPITLPGTIPNTSADSSWTITSDNNFNNGTMNKVTIEGTGSSAELELRLSEDSWNERFPGNDPGIHTRTDMVSIWGTDKIVLFGGYDRFSGKYNNDTWIYDVGDNTWTKQITNIRPKLVRLCAIAQIGGTDKVMIFGGEELIENGPNINETWIFDLSDKTWTNVTPTHSPLGRMRHSLSTISGTDKVLLFGGMTNVTVNHTFLNDTWVYDYSENKWTNMTTSIGPEKIVYHQMAEIYGTKNVILYGGIDYVYSNEIFVG